LQELTDEVHKLLGLTYTRPILEALIKQPTGLSFREIDVGVVGSSGSAGSAASTLRKLIDPGWVERKENEKKGDSRYYITKRGREALAYAKEGDDLVPPAGDGQGT
jgi:DNA-binding HxlR family transcriptional regulator